MEEQSEQLGREKSADLEKVPSSELRGTTEEEEEPATAQAPKEIMKWKKLKKLLAEKKAEEKAYEELLQVSSAKAIEDEQLPLEIEEEQTLERLLESKPEEPEIETAEESQKVKIVGVGEEMIAAREGMIGRAEHLGEEQEKPYGKNWKNSR
ncbi:hypothetical protein JTB14_019000 [Gonioctena quinquepunctata]|nr:hypothetical protein JTB14_019000 [Gonioctena quinquepunctata]